jgi:hypothetical protein
MLWQGGMLHILFEECLDCLPLMIIRDINKPVEQLMPF